MKTLAVNRSIVVSIVAMTMLIYGIQGIGYGEPQNNAPEFTPVCDRTPQVRDAIVAVLPGVSDCNDVTKSHLALITNLNLSDKNITGLKAGDFDGLSSLRTLTLYKNTLSSLPAGIFSGLDSLNRLDIGSNQLNSLPNGIFSGMDSLNRLNLSYNLLSSLQVDTFSGLDSLSSLSLSSNHLTSLPADIFSGLDSLDWLSLSSNRLIGLPDGIFSGLSSLRSLYLGDNSAHLSITVGLEQVGEDQFKATAPTGAPFNIVLPFSVTNGSIDGGATTVTIPIGNIESEPLTVIRTPGTSDDITIDIGTLPGVPTGHYGYRLVEPSPSSGDSTVSLSIAIPDYKPQVNHAPVFTEGSATTRSIPENTPAGVNIGAPVVATDEDEDTLTYSLGGIDAASFGVVSTTGQLQTRAPLDYETKNSYTVTVTVSDGELTDVITVGITVTDVYENRAPMFTEGSGTTRSVAENTPAGVNIGAPVSAIDLDEDILTYSLGGIDAASFEVVSTTGQLKTRAPLDYETKNAYTVIVTVSDGELTDVITVGITVTDVDENRPPMFTEGSGTTRAIAENTPAGVNIGAPVSAIDLDEDILTYSLSGIDTGSFGVVSTTGQLKTRAPLDYEAKNSYLVTVIVSDGQLTDEISVGITVIDVDETPTDHTPIFTERGSTTRAVAENTPAGVNIGNPVSATDEDDDDTLIYTLSGTDAVSFDIDRSTGQLKTYAPLDYETKNAYSVMVTVSDGSLTDSTSVTIIVTDVYENRAPEFTEGNSTTRAIAENAAVGVNIGIPVSAIDPDGDILTYTLSGIDAGSFGIVSTTGQLKTRAALDYEAKNAYTVIVTVSDGRLTDEISVGIALTDVDENRGPVFADDSTTRSIAENTPAGANIGNPVSATDPDDDDTLTYTLGGTDASSFDIVSASGQLRTRAVLDYETKNSYTVVVTVSDGRLTASISVAITVIDVDENRGPVFADDSTTRSIAENTPAGVNIGNPVSATDSDDDDTLTYTLGGTDASSFSIVSTSGQLKTRASLDYETKNAYLVTVMVSDGRLTDAIRVTITVIDVDEVSPEPISSKVSISEIMFGSERRFSPPQWIELHNAGADIINLTGWTLTIQNRNSPELTGPTTPPVPLVNATITFKDDFWGDAPRIWPDDTVLVVSRDIGENSGNLSEEQIYDLGWRQELGLGLWTPILSTEGFYIKLTDDAGNLVDEAGNLNGDVLQWKLPYGENRGRTRDGRRTSMIRRYADSIALNGTQAGGWISAVDANLTAEQLTYYGDKNDISTPGVGIIINEVAPQFTQYDVNQDGVVNILDLVLIAGRFGQSGPNAADVNRDGVVNVLDLIKVAGALNQTAAAPSAHPAALAMLNAADVQGWLAQARGLALTDATSQRGIIFLEQLLFALIPKETALLSNYPNPFNPETWIPYRLAHAADVQITIYNTRGTVVRRLDVGHQSAGFYTDRAQAAYWDGRNSRGELVASGLYFYQLRAGDYTALRRMVVVK